MRFINSFWIRKSSVYKGPFYVGHNSDKIEQMIDLLFEDIGKYDKITDKKISHFNKLDIEVMVAHLTARLESAKAVQFGLAFIAILFVSITGLTKIIFGESADAYLYVIFVALLGLTIIEYIWRNRLINYSFLKDLLQSYKNEKYKNDK